MMNKLNKNNKRFTNKVEFEREMLSAGNSNSSPSSFTSSEIVTSDD